MSVLDLCCAPPPIWLTPAQIPTQLRPQPAVWRRLLDTGSLTATLIALSGGEFRVEVLRQTLASPSLPEQRCLGMGLRQLALVREVVLYGNNEPWVFARSVLPLTSLTGPLRHLRKQGNRPLGAFLFSQPHLRRGAIALARINRHHAYLAAGLAGTEAAWGRRSVFSLNHKPLLVSEVFLDSLCRLLTS